MAASQAKTAENASNVYLFKNGYGMIVKTFEFPTTNSSNRNSVDLVDLPSHAVHGTFWIQPTTPNVSINSIRTKKRPIFVEKPCLNVEDLVKANVGENVHMNIVDGMNETSQWVSGKIGQVQSSDSSSSDDEDENSSNRNEQQHPQIFNTPAQRYAHFSPTPKKPKAQGKLVILETTDDGALGLSLSDVRSIRSTNLKTKYQKKVFRNCLSIDYQNQSESVQGGIMKYLTYGITWVPSYDVVLLDASGTSEKKLHLSSKAVILNDIENIHVKNLFCIVGFPNVSKFASVTDPIIANKNVKEFLEQLQQSETTASFSRHYGHPSVMSNSVMTQQMVMPMHGANNHGADVNPTTTDNDDLHLYDFHDVLLEKKKRLILPIFNVQLPYKDVYSCEFGSDIYNHYGVPEQKQEYEEVWHSIEIKNDSNFIWTTAPAVVTKGSEEQQFLGQDKITYTLKGSTALVKLTKALDIRVQADESITETNPNRVVFSRQRYQTDTITGNIIITNHKAENISIVIKMKTTGKMVDFSIKPTKDIIKPNSNAVNQSHEICWELNINAKQTVAIKHVRHHHKPV